MEWKTSQTKMTKIHS